MRLGALLTTGAHRTHHTLISSFGDAAAAHGLRTRLRFQMFGCGSAPRRRESSVEEESTRRVVDWSSEPRDKGRLWAAERSGGP